MGQPTNHRYARLGVHRVVNAAGTFTSLGGSLLPPPVGQAMTDGADWFVDIGELQTAVGARLAELTGNEATYVSGGAAAGIVVTLAACMAGTDPAGVDAFPRLTGLHRTDVVVFRSQRNAYDYAARQTGARLVEIDGTETALTTALCEQTACVLYFAGAHFAAGALPLERVVEIAHARSVPVIVDAAAQIPPVASLWRFTREAGADAAIFSGGKGLRGPQPSGLVVGRRDIIDGCRAHGCPNAAIGRPMKVGKEEMLGLLAAVEWSLGQDEPATLAGYERTVAHWIDELGQIPGVSTERGYPSIGGLPHGRAIVTFAPPCPWTREQVEAALWEQDPRIAVVAPESHPDGIALNPQMLRPDEDILVLETLKRILAGTPTGVPANREQENVWLLSTQGWTNFNSNHLPNSSAARE